MRPSGYSGRWDRAPEPERRPKGIPLQELAPERKIPGKSQTLAFLATSGDAVSEGRLPTATPPFALTGKVPNGSSDSRPMLR